MPRGPRTQRTHQHAPQTPAKPGGPAHTLNHRHNHTDGLSQPAHRFLNPGPGEQGSQSPRPPQTPNLTGPTMSHTHTHTRIARPARAPTPILAAPGDRGRRAGQRPGQQPPCGLRRGLALGASAAPAPRSARPSGGQPHCTQSAATAASASSYARARRGAGAGQSEAPPF